MPAPLTPYLLPIVLLFFSNIFMIFAWYGHLKYKTTSLLLVILVSWLIALPEYMLAVPANRLGHSVYSAVQLKTIQEIMTLVVFVGFVIFWLGEPLRWNHLVGFGFLVLAAFFIFLPGRP